MIAKNFLAGTSPKTSLLANKTCRSLLGKARQGAREPNAVIQWNTWVLMHWNTSISLYSITSCNYAYQFRYPVDLYITNPTALNMQWIFRSVLSMLTANYLRSICDVQLISFVQNTWMLSSCDHQNLKGSVCCAATAMGLWGTRAQWNSLLMHLKDLQLPRLFQSCFFSMFQYLMISLSCMRYVAPWPYVCGCNRWSVSVRLMCYLYTISQLLDIFYLYLFLSEAPFTYAQCDCCCYQLWSNW